MLMNAVKASSEGQRKCHIETARPNKARTRAVRMIRREAALAGGITPEEGGEGVEAWESSGRAVSSLTASSSDGADRGKGNTRSCR